ncbi:MAG: ABC transporter substrate-binding protein, partial [Acetobacteraceae bacterium]|nr:ABC transporter substrate-binding protein [Acetobacteraceae bacterium]
VATLDEEQREQLLRQAVQMATDDVAVIPLYQLINIWATRRGLTYAARMDERTIATAVRPAN